MLRAQVDLKRSCKLYLEINLIIVKAVCRFYCVPVVMQDRGTFISPFLRQRCLAAAAPAGKAKLTHPGKAILAGKLIIICHAEKSEFDKMSLVTMKLVS